jgi:hypothetical protein
MLIAGTITPLKRALDITSRLEVDTRFSTQMIDSQSPAFREGYK